MIGPGRVVLVVGPSGAGKDTLIAGVRAACTGDPLYVFPRRVVTRPGSDAEDNDSVDPASFERAVADGAFALWWRAHGNGYGIPIAIDGDIRAGRTVICNVSRTVVAPARQRYESVTAVGIAAPAAVLAARLAGRLRRSDGDLGQRLDRSAALERTFTADAVIDNSGPLENGVSDLFRIVRGCV